MNKIAINKETVKILVLRNEHPAPWYLKIKKGKRYFDWKTFKFKKAEENLYRSIAESHCASVPESELLKEQPELMIGKDGLICRKPCVILKSSIYRILHVEYFDTYEEAQREYELLADECNCTIEYDGE